MAVEKKSEIVVIGAPKFVHVSLRIQGNAPLVIQRFSKKFELMDRMATAAVDKPPRAVRVVRDYASEYEAARHKSTEGWDGICAAAFRSAMIRACSAAKIQMTQAKMALFIEADGFDVHDGVPLVRIHSKNGPEQFSAPARNDNGSVDIRVRPLWREWWCKVRIKFDADMLSAQSVANLLMRAGIQVGVGEGRPFSKESHGQGWGTFDVVAEDQTKEAV